MYLNLVNLNTFLDVSWLENMYMYVEKEKKKAIKLKILL